MEDSAAKTPWTARLARRARRVARFVNRDVWDLEVSALRGARRSLVRTVRVLYLVARGFRRNECMLHASSLTFMTLLAIVPVLALALSLASAAVDIEELRESARAGVRKFFEAPVPGRELVVSAAGLPAADAEEAEEAEVGESEEGAAAPADRDPPEPEFREDEGISVEKLEALVDKGFETVRRLNFRALGGVGLLVLVWTVIGLLGNIEKSFNHVWGVAKPRTFARKFTDYLSVVIILPFLCAAASSVPVVSAVTERLHRMEGAVGAGTACGPFFRTVWVLGVLSLAFCFLLRFAPNTRVRLRPGLLGGFVAAVGLFFWLKLCLVLQIGVAKNSALFGSFATVPILLTWVYVSWTILLVAAEVSYAAQNADSYEMETGWDTPSPRARLLLSVALLRALAAEIESGSGTLSLGAFTRRHRISFRFARVVARGLCDAGLLAPVDGEPDTFASRTDLSKATVGSIARTLLDAGSAAGSLGLDGLAQAKILSDGVDRALAATPPLSALPADPGPGPRP